MIVAADRPHNACPCVASLHWVLLSMAHYRLGNRDQALFWLGRVGSYKSSTDRIFFDHEGEIIRLLRSEAEALVVYDPIFPADPFVR